ncbi:Proteoglycan-4, partial [Trapelia coarctata]|nr:Proteoglycan-4 [Trapelia coarctata]
MANAAQQMPVELLQKIFADVELLYLPNAMARLAPLELALPVAPAIQRHTLDLEKATKTLKWRQHGSKALRWFQVGRHEATLAFGDLKSENSSSLGKRVFPSNDGRVLLRSVIDAEGKAVNLLFATDDVTSFLCFWGQKDKSYQEFASANREHLGNFIVAEDVRPSFLVALPETRQLVDASFHHRAKANSTICGFKNPTELATSLYKEFSSLQFMHRIETALLAADRQMTVLSAVLEASKHIKLPWQKQIGPKWRTIDLETVEDVCKGHSEPSAVQLDLKFEVVMAACHEGIEIIYLFNRDSRPGKQTRPLEISRKLVKLPDDSPGPALSMAPTNNASVILTRSTEFRSLDSADGMTTPPNPSWATLEQLGWSRGPGAQCFIRMPSEAQFVNTITHAEREFVFWNAVEKVTQISYHEQPPTALAACFRPYLYIVAASYLATAPQNPRHTCDTPESSIGRPETPDTIPEIQHLTSESPVATPDDTAVTPEDTTLPQENPPPPPKDPAAPPEHPTPPPPPPTHVTEDIYLSLFHPPTTTTDGTPLATGSSSLPNPHYIGSLTTPHGLSFLRLDMRVAGNLRDRGLANPAPAHPSPSPACPSDLRYTIPSHRARPHAGAATGERIFHADLSAFEGTGDSNDLVVL